MAVPRALQFYGKKNALTALAKILWPASVAKLIDTFPPCGALNIETVSLDFAASAKQTNAATAHPESPPEYCALEFETDRSRKAMLHV